MTRESTILFYKISIAVLGIGCFLLALFNFKPPFFSWQFAVVFLFTVLIAPRMSITLPRSKFSLYFADSMVFLTFLYFGGEAAIIIASAQTIADSLYSRFKGATLNYSAVAFNLGAISLSTGFTYYVWSWIPRIFNLQTALTLTTNLIVMLAVLGLSQLLASTIFASILHALKNDTAPWQAWKKQVISVSVAHFAGVGLAGIVFKLLNYADVYAISISLIAFAIIYYNYRQIIDEMTSSIELAEQAERDKGEAEREKRHAIERYADEL
ncbi:MAG TPA: hypothetical protein VGC97_20075, partial [Pyrinomonadaceae bacterium]